MPILEISDGQGNLAPFAAHRLCARMHHPQDTRLYREQLSWNLAYSLATEEKSEALTFPAFALRSILSAPSYREVQHRAAHEFAYGMDMGELLHIVLALQFNHPEQRPSVSKAWDLFAWHRKKDKRAAHSIAHFKKQWTHFKSAVHLWAALYYLRLDHGDEYVVDLVEMNRQIVPTRIDELKSFLAIADLLRLSGEEIRPLGGRAPLLDPSVMWTMPPDLRLPLAAVQPLSLSAEQLKVLEARRVPRRILPETIE